jgi:hypothetical protein
MLLRQFGVNSLDDLNHVLLRDDRELSKFLMVQREIPKVGVVLLTILQWISTPVEQLAYMGCFGLGIGTRLMEISVVHYSVFVLDVDVLGGAFLLGHDTPRATSEK